MAEGTPRVLRVTLAKAGNDITEDHAKHVASLARCTAPKLVFQGEFASDSIERAKTAWRIRMSGEHVSSALFLKLGLQLFEANATLDAQGVMARMALDEVRHAEVCGAMLEALGAPASTDSRADSLVLAKHLDCSAEERAIRNVIYHCALTETVNAARFVRLLEAATEPATRSALRLLLADERQHGAFGYQYLEAWAPWLATRLEVRASLARYLRYAFAYFEERMRLGTSAPRATNDDRALGLGDPEELDEALDQTLVHAIVPGLERFGIAAEEAFRTRRLDL